MRHTSPPHKVLDSTSRRGDQLEDSESYIEDVDPNIRQSKSLLDQDDIFFDLLEIKNVLLPTVNNSDSSVFDLENELQKIKITSEKTKQNDNSLKQSEGYVQVESRATFTTNLQAQSHQENMTDAVSTHSPRRDVEKRTLEEGAGPDPLLPPNKKQRDG